MSFVFGTAGRSTEKKPTASRITDHMGKGGGFRRWRGEVYHFGCGSSSLSNIKLGAIGYRDMELWKVLGAEVRDEFEVGGEKIRYEPVCPSPTAGCPKDRET